MSISRATQFVYVVFFVFIIQVVYYEEYKLHIRNAKFQLCDIFRFFATYLNFGFFVTRRTKV